MGRNRKAALHIDPHTRQELAALRHHPAEPLDAVLKRLLALVPPGDTDGTYRPAVRASLLSAMAQARSRRIPQRIEVLRHITP